MQGLQDCLPATPVLRPKQHLSPSSASLRRATSAVLPRQQSAEPGGGDWGPATPASRGCGSKAQLWLSRGALRRLSAVDPAAAVAAVPQQSADAPEQDDAARVALSLESSVLQRLQVWS